MKTFSISYDFKTTKNPDTDNENFRKLFIEFLLLKNAKDINSYNESTITFKHHNEINNLGNLIKNKFSDVIRFQLVEVVTKNEKIHIYGSYNRELYENFKKLIQEVKENM